MDNNRERKVLGEFSNENAYLLTCHLLTRSLELIAKNVLSASVATAFAKKDFPVPGGP